MELVIPIHHTMDFDFNSARSSPVHLRDPSTPKRFGEFYCSAPNSPTRLSQFYREFDEFLISSKTGDSSAAVPFAWEEKPGTPKSSSRAAWKKEDDDFAFDIRDDMEIASLSAEELFDGGVIKPLKPPPRLLSPSPQKTNQRPPPGPERGRGRAPPGQNSSSRRAARSLSPLRVSQYPWEEEQSDQQQLQEKNTMKSSLIPKPAANSGSSSALASISKGYKKWRLKDFFLFRSASEGRASDKDPLKKYTAAFRRFEDVKTSSLRNIDSPSGSVSSRRRNHVSAHELHYTVNKAVSDDLKKKTFLPYKQGILGRLAFNPAVHALANGFGLSHK